MTDKQCERCGEANPAEIHTCTPKQEEGCAGCGKKASEGWALYCVKCSEPVREWQGLTDEEVFAALVAVDGNTQRLAPGFVSFYCAIEAKLKEKNT